MPLFIMLAQQRRFIATSTDSPHLKLIAELYDKCQETLYLVRRQPLCHSSFSVMRLFSVFHISDMRPDRSKQSVKRVQ